MARILCSCSRSGEFTIVDIRFYISHAVCPTHLSHLLDATPQENAFGEEVDPVHCIKRQRTKDWEIQRIGSGKYHVQPMFSGSDPGR